MKCFVRSLAVMFLALFFLTLAGCGGTGGAVSGNGSGSGSDRGAGGSISAVNHVIIMFQENRSFDQYFGQMTAYRTANNIPINSSDGKINDLSSGNFSNISPATGAPIAPYHTGSTCTEDLTPNWAESHKMMNLKNSGAASPTSPMDGFVNVAYFLGQFYTQNGVTIQDNTGRRTIGYFNSSDFNYYYFMASNFAMGDAFYSPVPSRTAVNRLYIHAATSHGHAHDPSGVSLPSKTIWQELDENNISWKIYVTDKNPAGTPPLFTYLAFFTYWGAPGVQAKVVSLDQYFTDVKNGTLPNVAFIETGQFSGRDEHPSNVNLSTLSIDHIDVQFGATFASGIINALMNSPSWKDSVFFFTFDEGGGAYDHVPPMAVSNPDGIPPTDLLPEDPAGDFTITGFRIPNFIVSPFARKNFVSHTSMDFTAYLKFIETRWNLPPLTKRDAQMPDMTEFFNFANPPWATPPTPPVQTMAGVCDFSLE